MSLPLAFEWLNPWMLGWLAAAAAPLLIHLWNRRRHEETYFAAIEFLLRAVEASRRRLRLEQWLLLAVRTLILVLAVLAAADPLWEGSMVVSARGQPTHRVLVLDASLSMGYRAGGKSRFERAKEIAVRIVDESLPGDGFTLVVMASPPRTVVATPARNPAEFRKELDALELWHGKADLAQTLAAVEQVLLDAQRDAPGLTAQEVYFLTDLARSDWSLAHYEPAVRESFVERSRRLAGMARLVVIDLGQSDAANAAVSELTLDEPAVLAGDAVEVRAEVRLYGPAASPETSAPSPPAPDNHSQSPEADSAVQLLERARRGLGVALVLDGRPVDKTTLRLAPGEKTTVVFPWRFETPGEHLVEVRLEPDGLEIDNHRYRVVPVRQRLRVLCVDGRPSSDPYRSATGYLVAALAPMGPTAGRVEPQVIPDSRLQETPLAGYDCVFLADVARFTAAEAHLLEGYLKAGGGIVFFLGPQVQTDSYNRELAGGQVRVLPIRLGPVVVRKDPMARLNPLEYRHPVIRVFQGQEAAGLLTTPVFRHFRLEMESAGSANVVLATAEGLPLIVEESMHRGRVIVVGTAADDPQWSALPLWPSFVPLVQEMLQYAVVPQVAERTVLVGQALGDTLPVEGRLPNLVITTPRGRGEEVRIQEEGDVRAWSFTDTGVSGLYTARYGPPASRNDLFAVNFDSRPPDESDVASLDAEELQQEVWPNIPFVHQTSFQKPDLPASVAAARPNRLARVFLYMVLCLVLVETFLARRASP